jgi:hypothetical protein
VLNVLRKEKLYVRKDKCAWMKAELFYLGHIVSASLRHQSFLTALFQ